MRLFAAIGLVMSIPLSLLAQEHGCEAAQTQMEMTQCSADEWRLSDDDLNAAYLAAIDVMVEIDFGLPSSERGGEQALRRAQRSWIAMRDETCLAEGYLMHGGSAEPMMVSMCKTRLTQIRAADLWEMAADY